MFAHSTDDIWRAVSPSVFLAVYFFSVLLFNKPNCFIMPDINWTRKKFNSAENHCFGTMFSNYAWQNSDVVRNFCVQIWNLRVSVRLKIWFPCMLPCSLLVGLFFDKPAYTRISGILKSILTPLLVRKDSCDYWGFVCSVLDTAVQSLNLAGQTPCFLSSADSSPSILLISFSLGFMRGITTKMSWASLEANTLIMAC